MLSADNLSVIEEEGHRLLDFARRDPARMVPQYPTWSLTDLTLHVGSIHARTIVICETLPVERVAAPIPPSGADVFEWYDRTLVTMLAALRSADPASPTWGFGSNGTLGFWEERMVIETGIHRWDAQQAFEDPDDLPAAVAIAGLDEFTEMWLPRLGPLPAIELVATDANLIWVYGEGDPGDRISGSLSHLFLRLMARASPVSLPDEWAEAVDGLATPAD